MKGTQQPLSLQLFGGPMGYRTPLTLLAKQARRPRHKPMNLLVMSKI